MNIFSIHLHASIDLVLLALGKECKRFVLCHCHHATGSPRAVSMYGRVKFPRARFTCGCSGPSSVTIELSLLATSMTCVFLASKRMSVCEFISSSFTTLTDAFFGMVLNEIFGKLLVRNTINPRSCATSNHMREILFVCFGDDSHQRDARQSHFTVMTEEPQRQRDLCLSQCLQRTTLWAFSGTSVTSGNAFSDRGHS